VGTPDGVALLPADARADDPSGWLPLTELLTALKNCPAKRKLLLLDLGQAAPMPQAGVLLHNAPERAHDLLTRWHGEDPNLQVLCACSPGQTSLASDELGHTVFAHFLLQALSGKADGALP